MAIGGSGTQADPWTIGSSADLVAFAGSTSYWASGTYARLTADIDMTGVSFTPIGNDEDTYYGTFDGNRHTIRNLTITNGGTGIGLFGYTNSGATIQDICCDGFNVTGTDSVGGLAGFAYSSSFMRCSVINSTIVSSEYGQCGGLIGVPWGGSIANCYASNCTVSGPSEVGGLCGMIRDVSIANCYMYNCTVTGSSSTGGLVGYSYCHLGSSGLSNCAIYGGTKGDTLIGLDDYEEWEEPTPVTNCYTANDITSAVFHTQGFWDGTGVSGTTYLSWDFTTPVWYWDATVNLPVLQQAATAPAIRTKVSGTWKDVDKTLVKINGMWKEVSKAFVKVSGSWKEAA